MVDLKTIEYRGGLVTFSIPASWCEEYGPEGGGTFYGHTPHSGTLRLNVITMKSRRDMTEDSIQDAIVKVLPGPGHDREVTRLPNGNAMVRYIEPASENGEELQLHYWEVANPLPPRTMRLAVFSYSMLAAQASDPTVRAELELLDKLISEAEFAKVPGVSGRYPPKPWWKFW
jgi:hypothetical protein